MTLTNKPNMLFWVVAIIALLWNIMGIFQFIGPLLFQDIIFEGLSQDAVNLYNNFPNWYTVIFGIATISGLVGAITLLMRKKVTVFLFLVSMITVFIVEGYYILGTKVTEIMGQEAIYMPIVVIVFSVFLYFYAKAGMLKGWLH